VWPTAKFIRPLLLCSTAVLMAACTRVLGGVAVPASGPPPRLGVNGVKVDAILLDQSRMRAITGGGEHLTIIPSMDGDSPVDIEALAQTAPRACRFIYAETATFGPDVAEFHKTTFQDPPDGGLISEGAASYRDVATARGAFAALVSTVGDCATSEQGDLYIGEWNADANSLQVRPGGCGRDYRVVSLALLEVTFCGFPPSVSDIVMTNIANNVPN